MTKRKQPCCTTWVLAVGCLPLPIANVKTDDFNRTAMRSRSVLWTNFHSKPHRRSMPSPRVLDSSDHHMLQPYQRALSDCQTSCSIPTLDHCCRQVFDEDLNPRSLPLLLSWHGESVRGRRGQELVRRSVVFRRRDASVEDIEDIKVAAETALTRAHHLRNIFISINDIFSSPRSEGLHDEDVADNVHHRGHCLSRPK